MQEQWEACSAAIMGRMPEQAYRTWIKPLVLLEFNTDECLIRLGATNQIKADIVRNQYLGVIEEVLRDAIDPSIRVEVEVNRPHAAPASAAPVTVPPASAPAAVMPSPARPAIAPAAGMQPPREPLPTGDDDLSMIDEDDNADADGEHSANAFSGLANRAVHERSRLDPGLSFATFVTGKANDLARAAALQVAERPGTSYNPLYIHGGSGLGKTHLMQAIGNAVLQREPTAAIRYVSTQQFLREMVSALRQDTMDKFQHAYRSLDMLLIDDIQFLSEKQRTQEEFFYIFESMVINQRQIVITSDTYPKEIKALPDRLISRLNSGLIVAIEPPELEMRVAILQRKAEQARVRLPEDVAYFIGKNIRQNVRELEGALQRVIHYAAFRSQSITLDLVKEALKDILSFNRGQISIDLIQRTVADFYKIKLADMYSKRKPAKIALPRQIAMYLAKELTQKSLPEIGEAFGGKDHTTVLYAVRKITELRAHESELNRQIHVLDQTLREFL